jgi:hypothetical protein
VASKPTNSFGFTIEVRESAKLKLALLKENFNFERFYEELENDPYSVCPELRRTDEGEESFRDRICDIEAENGLLFGGHGETFGVNERFLLEAQLVGVSVSELLTLLNPMKDPIDVSSRKVLQMLPILFLQRGVQELYRVEKLARWGEQTDKGWSKLGPHERLLLIDLRKRKQQLIEEFQNFINKEVSLQKAARATRDKWQGMPFSYLLWEPYNSRQRKETWKQLEVWKLRKQDKTFKDVARELNITEDTARKSFYAGWFKTQGYAYDRERFREIIQSARKGGVLNPSAIQTRKYSLDSFLQISGASSGIALMFFSRSFSS